MDNKLEKHQGSCLCGDVEFKVTGPLRDVTYCHCQQCRKSTGHIFASTGCQIVDLDMVKDHSLEWYSASEHAKRGFCKKCGSSLFWHPTGSDRMAILAGSFDSLLSIKATKHIFIADKGSYYDVNDDLVKFEQDD